MEHEINTNSAEILHFGDVQYHLQSGLIVGADGEALHMRRQSAEVLAILAECRGQVVSKETLMQRVWNGVVTTDDSLVQCIADVRRVLGRSSVETYPKRGYRLKLPPQVVEPANEIQAQASPGRWQRLVAAGCVVLAVGALLLWRHADNPQGDAIVPPIIKQEKTIAVLPFTDLSGDPDLVYFSNGLGEDLTTDLSKVSGLTVIAYASALGYPNAESGFRGIADELGVRYLVRGTVRHSDEQVRINVSLVDPVEGFNLWTERYDRIRVNPFDVQSEVTREIVNALALELDVNANQPRSVEPDANTMLLRGLESMRALTADGNRAARDYFKRAIAFDPDYARAYASIAMSYARDRLITTDTTQNTNATEQGLQSAIKAVQLDSGSPYGYYALGLLNLSLGEFELALSASRHALRLDPNYADGYALLAEAGLYGGDLNEALDSIRRARLLHPHHPPSYQWTEGHILYQLGKYREAGSVLQSAYELSDGYSNGLLLVAANAAMTGDFSKARRVVNELEATQSDLQIEEVLAQIPYAIESRRTVLAEGLGQLIQ